MGRFFSAEANCTRARAWVSQEIDGELSQLECVFLSAHLRRCEQCAHFAEDVRAVTQRVRSAPLERPQLDLALPARRRGAHVAVKVALAGALVSAAAGLGVLTGSMGAGSREPAPSPVGDVALVSPQSGEREVANPRRVKAEQPRERVAPPGRLGGSV
jgi:predicted anti-sigma-YlaC factor YlaD